MSVAMSLLYPFVSILSSLVLQLERLEVGCYECSHVFTVSFRLSSVTAGET